MAYLTDDSVVARMYSGFRGADFRGEEVNLVRSPDCLNVWKDYKHTDSIRTRPGLELHTSFPAPVYGVFFFNGITIVHSGKNLYTVTAGGKKTIIFSSANEALSNSFTHDNCWYFKDGKNYLEYDGSTIKAVEGYVPTTTIGRKPAGGGTVFQDVNMLSSKRKNSFLADGKAVDYYLDAKNIDSDFVPVVTVNDTVLATNKYTVNYAEGRIRFTTAPTSPLTDGQDNVVVEFKKHVAGHSERILESTLLQIFDNRVFFSGNEEYPNTLWHCSLDDPTYCSDTDYYNEGMDSAPIKGMVPGNNGLWVFREPTSAGTTIFYHTPALDDQFGKIYPSTHSSITTGCVGKAINFGDDIVFFSERGMEGISGDVTTEQVIGHRSSLVDRKLLTEADYKSMILEEWDGYLMVFIGDKVYLADSRAVFTNENHYEYEWFYWDIGKQVKSTCVHNGVLYLGAEDGLYTLTDYETPVESWWVTPKDKFKHPHKLKTTNKKGSVTEATGDVSVYVKTERTDFELVGTHENVTDYFVNRIKRKKFKDLQIKFYSQTRFSLETTSLEVFVGAYIKR